MLPASLFYRAVREFAVTSPVWDSRRVNYQTLPDEEFDLTLVSQRVYGNRREHLAVLAAAGLDTYDQRLEQRIIILPSPAYLEEIKRATGFVS